MECQVRPGHALPATVLKGIFGRSQSRVAEDTAGSKSDLLHFMTVY